MSEMAWGEVLDWIGRMKAWISRIEALVKQAGGSEKDPLEPVPEDVMRALGDLVRRVPTDKGGSFISRGSCVAPNPDPNASTGGPRPKRES